MQKPPGVGKTQVDCRTFFLSLFLHAFAEVGTCLTELTYLQEHTVTSVGWRGNIRAASPLEGPHLLQKFRHSLSEAGVQRGDAPDHIPAVPHSRPCTHIAHPSIHGRARPRDGTAGSGEWVPRGPLAPGPERVG